LWGFLLDFLFIEDLDFVWVLFFADLWVLLCFVDLAGAASDAAGVVGATAGEFTAGAGAAPEEA
jgi:hypothetical protein